MQKIIIYHGRFQPPHLGHIYVISQALNTYKNSKIFISIDERQLDTRNPFSFQQRKRFFLKFLKNKYSDKIIFNKHTWQDYNITLQKILNEASKYGKVEKVLFGPNPDRKTISFWNSKKIQVSIQNERFLNLSSTDIRRNLNKYFQEIEKISNNNISIITNFGCNSNCWYCIWKTHKLKQYKCASNQQISNFLAKYQFKDKFSISGGGDCLKDYEKHKDFWNLIFELANKFDMKVDIHSREHFRNANFWKKINKLVISSDILSDCKDFLDWVKNYTQVRITHVVTKYTTEEIIDEYLEYITKNNFQFTLKELVGYDDNGMYRKLKNKYPELFYLDKGDYNIYLMPDGNEYTDFLIK